jgi:SAM-dependent methyltransferase
MGSDVNFDGIATAFEDEIYGSSKGRIRLEVLWDDLLEGVPALARGGLRILDAGGGAGHMAVRLGRLGNEVVLCEPSREMLDRAEAAIGEAGLLGMVRTVRTGIQDLAGVLEDEAFDVITCHAVLEWLADPQAAIGRLAEQLGSNGLMSLMFYTPTRPCSSACLAGTSPTRCMNSRPAQPGEAGERAPFRSERTPFASGFPTEASPSARKLASAYSTITSRPTNSPAANYASCWRSSRQCGTSSPSLPSASTST